MTVFYCDLKLLSKVDGLKCLSQHIATVTNVLDIAPREMCSIIPEQKIAQRCLKSLRIVIG